MAGRIEEQEDTVGSDGMDMWESFRNSTRKPEYAPQAASLFDKLPVLQHLGKALDTMRKAEYRRWEGEAVFFETCLLETRNS